MGTVMGSRVKELRELRGFSQPELAERVGISQPSLSNIEQGKTKALRGKTLAGLCEQLGVSHAELTDPRVPLRGVAATSEAELLTIWRTITAEDQAHLLAMGRAFRDRMRSAPRPAPGDTFEERAGRVAQLASEDRARALRRAADEKHAAESRATASPDSETDSPG